MMNDSEILSVMSSRSNNFVLPAQETKLRGVDDFSLTGQRIHWNLVRVAIYKHELARI